MVLREAAMVRSTPIVGLYFEVYEHLTIST